MNTKPTVLCIVGALFGRPFMIEAKRLGWNVHLLTEERYLKEAWPRDQIDEVFAVPDLFDEKVVRNVVCYLSRKTVYDRIVGLGEFDIEVAASLREHTRIPGMGETTSRYFRDKLAMRLKTEEDGIKVPAFTRILHHSQVAEFMNTIEAPWVLKPRMGASSAKVQKMFHAEEVWKKIEELGDKQSSFLLEKYIPGDVYHVDSLVSERKVVYASCSKYGTSMLDINTTGGIFTSRQLEKGSEDELALQKINQDVTKSLGLLRGTMHNEYIKSKETGEFYFLEASARVGGARIPDIIYHASGLCLWHEWAKIELAEKGSKYKLPKMRDEYGGGIFTLARQEEPSLEPYNDPEVRWKQKKKHFAGLTLSSPDPKRVEELLMNYYPRFARDFMAHVPIPQ
ncbi:MAG: acetyl-CoA carboxylase biotin carboxylase subunit family protein [Candidatus Kapaibacterium sp.]|jgi:formate-dependent phosphoribosylglycinamide formyltransferase (GAR transformylase)